MRSRAWFSVSLRDSRSCPSSCFFKAFARFSASRFSIFCFLALRSSSSLARNCLLDSRPASASFLAVSSSSESSSGEIPSFSNLASCCLTSASSNLSSASNAFIFSISNSSSRRLRSSCCRRFISCLSRFCSASSTSHSDLPVSFSATTARVRVSSHHQSSPSPISANKSCSSWSISMSSTNSWRSLLSAFSARASIRFLNICLLRSVPFSSRSLLLFSFTSVSFPRHRSISNCCI